MEKEKLKELIIGHKEKFLSRGGLVRREIQDEIANYIPQREVLIITGALAGRPLVYWFLWIEEGNPS